LRVDMYLILDAYRRPVTLQLRVYIGLWFKDEVLLVATISVFVVHFLLFLCLFGGLNRHMDMESAFRRDTYHWHAITSFFTPIDCRHSRVHIEALHRSVGAFREWLVAGASGHSALANAVTLIIRIHVDVLA